MDTVITAVDAIARELMLFAAVGFLLGGADDLLVDVLWLVGRVRARFAPDRSLADVSRPAEPMRFAVFVAAWREERVIGAMLRAALRMIDHQNYRIYVGTYPNDPETIAAVEEIAAVDPRVRLVVGPRNGPTTKGDNLNVLWRALLADEAHGDARGERPTGAVILHDAEDLLHPDELAVHEVALAHAEVSQIPVVPLIDRSGVSAHLVSGHYADEFAMSHRAGLVVRTALRAGLPLAGVGCAVRVEALARLGVQEVGPFEPNCLTEDYEQGLRLATLGCRARFMRVRGRDGSLVATRAYFPRHFGESARQKARWMVGIALDGWDRIGWSRPLALAEHWMRMRDRRAPLAVVVLAAAYLALVLWCMSWAIHAATGIPGPVQGSGTRLLLKINGALLVWRMGIRMVHTAAEYGWKEGLRSIPRIVVANAIALLAVRRALWRYVGVLRGAELRWDKTEHVFPDLSTERQGS